MADLKRILTTPEGYRSREVGLFVAQFDDQSRRLIEDTRGASLDELEWQQARGTNTIGMLLAHIAIVEAHWIHVVVHGSTPSDVRPVLGIDKDDDGMPIPEDGLPPETLRRKDLAYFDDLLARARAHTKQVLAGFSDAELDREITRIGVRDGNSYHFNVRWILYHILEHEAGHYGQINLLRHLYRASIPAAEAKR